MRRGLLVLVAVISVLVGAGCSVFDRSSAASRYFTDPAHLELARAVARGDVDQVRTLVAQGTDPNSAGPGGTTMLQWAILAESPEGLSALLDAGADPDLAGSGARTPLHDAAGMEDATFAELLLGAGVDPDVRDGTGSTPLRHACLSIRSAPFEVLVAAGADVEAVDDLDETPIFTCARTNAGGLVLRLLELGADPERRNPRGDSFQEYYFGYDPTVLNDRARQERRDVVAWLEDHDVDVIPEARR